MEDIRAIDCLNFPHYCDPDLAVKILQFDEFKIVFETTFKAMGVVSEDALRSRSLNSVGEMIKEMDSLQSRSDKKDAN